jgi:predicted nucleic acid-binding protein
VKFLADTNLVSELTKARPDPAALAWIRKNDADLVLSWVSVAELRAGVALMPQGRRREEMQAAVEALIEDFYEDSSVPLLDSTATFVAELARRHRDAGISPGWPDTVIAAVCLEHGLTVATRNTEDFPDVPTVNPWNKPA